MFVNRVNELEYLERISREKRARLLIVYGRRRIGRKSARINRVKGFTCCKIPSSGFGFAMCFRT